MSIVYILTNEAFPNYVKIGKISNLENRLKQLYNTSIIYLFECFFAGRIKNAEEVEKNLISLSLSAQGLLGYKHSVQGPAYWMYGGET